MRRWLRMATLQILRSRRPFWAGLRRGYMFPSAPRHIRSIAHATALQTASDDPQQVLVNAGGGSASTDVGGGTFSPWYKVRGVEQEKPLRDVVYYANLPHYPKAEDYETLADGLFHRPPRVELTHSIISHLKSQGFMNEWRELSKRPERLVWRHNFTFLLRKHRLQIVGEGSTPDSAYAAAFMGLIYQLHIFGSLRRVIDRNDLNLASEPLRLAFAWRPSEIAAKLHIHNFAARYLQTPEVLIDEQDDKSFTATVAIPHTSFLARASAKDRRKAEFLAFISLKQAIEDCLAREGHRVDLADDLHVNLDNSSGILDFYKLKAQYGHFQRVDEKVPGPQSATWHACRLLWDNRPISDFQMMPTRRDAMKLAGLEAAVRLVSHNPDLLREYQEASRGNAGFVPKRLSPTFASLSPSVVGTLADCVEAADEARLDSFELTKYTPGYKPVIGRRKLLLNSSAEQLYHNVAQSLAARSDELRVQQEWESDDPNFAQKAAARARLPVYQHKAQILAMVKNHDQCIVVGSTGSGKSTQVPQIILDDAIVEGRGALCNIMCTQPRRLACVALAATLCNERERDLGDIVGYRIGGDYHNFSRRGGSITYCTTELLANELERSDDELPHNVSHIIIDEIHERSVHLDRLLSMIKMTFSKRLAKGLKVPKLVMMSATVESNLFERYFEIVSQDGTVIRPPYLNIPGRMFETETKFLDTYGSDLPAELYQDTGPTNGAEAFIDSGVSFPLAANENSQGVVQWNSMSEHAYQGLATENNINTVAATIVHIVETTSDGAILAFVPGAREIQSVHQALMKQKRVDLADESQYQILMLHRSNPAHLAAALDTVPSGVRRIMISTNIAESSITFPDVGYVVDSGLRRNPSDLDIGHLQVLRDERISRANVYQRAGRAGRTKPGKYFGTFTTAEMEALDVFPEAEDIDQLRLEGLYLRAKVHFPNVTASDYFSSFLTPIQPSKLRRAEANLRNLGALNDSGEVSLIGYFLYRTTMTPSLARMVLLGILFQCLDQAIVLANLMPLRYYIFGDSRFSDMPLSDRKSTAKEFAGDSASDLIAQLRAFEEYKAVQSRDAGTAREWAKRNGLAYQHLDMLQTRVTVVRRILGKAGFFERRQAQDLNARAGNTTLLRMIICAGLYPNVAVHQRGPNFVTHQSLVAKVSPSSVTLPGDYSKPETYDKIQNSLAGTIMCYKDLLVSTKQRKNYYIANLTPISPLMLALFSNNVKARPDKHNQLLIDEYVPLKFSGDARAASVFLEFKKVFDIALLAGMQNVCEMWPSNKRKNLSTIIPDIIVQATQELLEYESGQARRRRDDVGSFSLKMHTEDWDTDALAHTDTTWTSVDIQSSDIQPLPTSSSQILQAQGNKSYENLGMLAPDGFGAENQVRDADGLSELPGDMDNDRQHRQH